MVLHATWIRWVVVTSDSTIQCFFLTFQFELSSVLYALLSPFIFRHSSDFCCCGAGSTFWLLWSAWWRWRALLVSFSCDTSMVVNNCDLCVPQLLVINWERNHLCFCGTNDNHYYCKRISIITCQWLYFENLSDQLSVSSVSTSGTKTQQKAQSQSYKQR